MTHLRAPVAALACGVAAAAPVQAAVDVQGNWLPSIGDPTVLGWLTAALYFVVAALAARNLVFARRTALTWSFWLVLCMVMVALGINKQLDLQTWFGIAGRRLAIEQGWYADRRYVQASFIVLLCVGAVAALAGARRYWARQWSEYRLSSIGVGLLCLFIVVRASTFHHIDRVFGFRLGDVRVGSLLEISGVLVVGAGCVWWHQFHRRRVRRAFMQQALRR